MSIGSTGSCRRVAAGGLAAAIALGSLACATPAQMRKVENRLTDLERSDAGARASGERDRLAELGAQLAAMQSVIASLDGRVEVAERRVEQALEEARAARGEANQAGGTAALAPAPPDDEPVSEEVQRYRDAYSKWRAGDASGCVDQFTKFLQTYPSSEYADDATYWLADCHFKQGNYSAAVLRFDDVARNFPTGSKAADALYRQGEALLRMGHGTAAGNAFEKVLRDYPDSGRAKEARRQLDLLRAG